MTEDSFDIEVDTNGELIPLTVEPKYDGNGNVSFDILKENKLYFSIECCSDEVEDTLVLTDEYKNKGLNEDLIAKVIDIVMSEEE